MSETRRRHVHIAERCEHEDTKRTLCDHEVGWSQWRVRRVPCEAEFCQVQRARQERAAGQEDVWVVECLAYWDGGRLRVTSSLPERCTCGAEHETGLALQGEEVPGERLGLAVDKAWRVRAWAATGEAAVRYARQVAKACAGETHPVFLREGG